MTQPKGRANRGRQQPDSDARSIFAVPGERGHDNSAPGQARDAAEITDQLDGISGGMTGVGAEKQHPA